MIYKFGHDLYEINYFYKFTFFQGNIITKNFVIQVCTILFHYLLLRNNTQGEWHVIQLF